MLVTGIVALAIWNLGPAWLHPYLTALALLALLGVAIVVIYYILQDRAERANLPSRSEYRWPTGWDVTRFHRVLMTYLKVHDWRIRSARAADADRLLLCIQRDRHHLTVLLLRPGLAPGPDDIAYLRAMQRRDGTWEAALITDAPARQEPQIDAEGTKLVMLDFEALQALGDALDGGPEEERRARAAQDKRRAARRARADA